MNFSYTCHSCFHKWTGSQFDEPCPMCGKRMTTWRNETISPVEDLRTEYLKYHKLRLVHTKLYGTDVYLDDFKLKGVRSCDIFQNWKTVHGISEVTLVLVVEEAEVEKENKDEKAPDKKES